MATVFPGAVLESLTQRGSENKAITPLETNFMMTEDLTLLKHPCIPSYLLYIDTYHHQGDLIPANVSSLFEC